MAKQKRNQAWIQEYFFLFIPKPLKDELLTSWLTRMAIEHRRTLPEFFSLFIRHDGSSTTRTDVDFLYDEKLLNSLVEKSPFSRNQILKMSLRSEEGHLYVCKDCLYAPKQIRKLLDKRTHYGLRYCPYCLTEDKIPYFRKKWRYTFYNTCPRHKIFLTDRCWVCYERINFSKIKHLKSLAFCSKCGNDLRTTLRSELPNHFQLGLDATAWFEEGLYRGYFEINGQKVKSLFVFESYTRLAYLLHRKENLILEGFHMLVEYKELCQKLELYSSKKASAVYLDFYLTSMVYFLFQEYPNNFIAFARSNYITYRDFTHGFDSPFWYKNMVGELVPIENKIGREISESEVLGAIKYLKDIGEDVTQFKVAEIIGCHSTIHKGFKGLYKSCKK